MLCSRHRAFIFRMDQNVKCTITPGKTSSVKMEIKAEGE